MYRIQPVSRAQPKRTEAIVWKMRKTGQADSTLAPCGWLTNCREMRLWQEARRYTDRLEDIQYYTGNHDIGFMMYCSYGNALRLKPEPKDKEILINSSESLCARFSPEIGLIRSWDFGDWSYPVIIDNMMNLEMLFWASEQTGNSKYRDIAIAHADKTLKNHFRENMTSYHVVSYSVPSGKVESKGTFQGYADSSAWARGQAWGGMAIPCAIALRKIRFIWRRHIRLPASLWRTVLRGMIIFLIGIMMRPIFRMLP